MNPKANGTSFKPGNPGGPGRSPTPVDIKEARALNRIELERLVNMFYYMSAAQIEKHCKDPNCTMLELLIASIFKKGLKEGDPKYLTFLLQTTIGKMLPPNDPMIPLPVPEPPKIKDVGVTIDVSKLSTDALREIANASPEPE